MNFQNFLQQSSSNYDYRRLVELCSSYGLNEQQTNQIIMDFKNGSFANDQSIDESFHQSLKDLDSHQEEEEQSKNISEQYSFKYNKKSYDQRQISAEMKQGPKDDSFPHDSFEQENKDRDCEAEGDKLTIFQLFFNERREFEKNLYQKVEEQKEGLKAELKLKQQKIMSLIKIKEQDNEIILGLKDTILKLTNMLHEKNEAYKMLAQGYEKLKIDNESISTQKSSKVMQISHNQSINSTQQRRSMVKQNCLTEIDQNRMMKKSSHKYIKEVTGKNVPKIPSDRNDRIDKGLNVLTHNQNREANNQVKNDQGKRQAIDINKYKGMIEKLRNSYEFR